MCLTALLRYDFLMCKGPVKVVPLMYMWANDEFLAHQNTEILTGRWKLYNAN